MGKKRSASEMSAPPPPPRRSNNHISIDGATTLQHVDRQLKLSLEPEITGDQSNQSSDQRAPSIKVLGKEILELGATKLTHQSKKTYEAKKMLEQGFRPVQTIKCPLNRLIGMRNKNLQREQKKVDRDRDSGLRVKNVKREQKVHKMGEDIGPSVRGNGPMKIKSFTAQRLDSRSRGQSMAKRMKR